MLEPAGRPGHGPPTLRELSGLTGDPVELFAADPAAMGVERRAVKADVAQRCRSIEADVTAPDLWDQAGEPFDPLVDVSSIDDLTGSCRVAVAENVARLARPGAVMLRSCSYATAEQGSGGTPSLTAGRERGVKVCVS